MNNSFRAREIIEKSLRRPNGCWNCKRCDTEENVPKCEYEEMFYTYYCNLGRFKNWESMICDFHDKY